MIIAVFDWDDTLFASSHFYSLQFTKSELTLLANSIVTLFETAKNQCDQIYIISNASCDWVNHCFSLLNIKNSIPVISSDIDTSPISQWKVETFQRVLTPLFQTNGNHQLISFGDCNYDRAASWEMKKNFPTLIVKNFLFLNKPYFFELLNEHILIVRHFRKIKQFLVDIDCILEQASGGCLALRNWPEENLTPVLLSVS